MSNDEPRDLNRELKELLRHIFGDQDDCTGCQYSFDNCMCPYPERVDADKSHPKLIPSLTAHIGKN